LIAATPAAISSGRIGSVFRLVGSSIA